MQYKRDYIVSFTHRMGSNTSISDQERSVVEISHRINFPFIVRSYAYERLTKGVYGHKNVS